MKKVIISIIFLFVFIPVKISAQQTLLTRMASVEVNGSLLSADNLGNIYIASESTLKKFDADGKLLYTYTGLSDGKINSVDVGDPLKILIFNADFGKIKYLDNTLSLKKDFILLSDLGYANATLVAASYENGFWLFDLFSNQVVRFDKNLKQTHSSGNCSDITGFEISPVFMTENDNMLYLYDPGNGILIFDRYATYMRLLPFKNLRSFQVIGQKIIFSEGNKLKMFDLKTFEEAVLIIPENEDIINALWNNDHVYVLKNKSLDVYGVSK
ncbi:MAG TPA: hypothetical protein PKW80_06535 [Bacteroidales bacterium]|nr:hypothetical protein [Bacteroidales bacterium]